MEVTVNLSEFAKKHSVILNTEYVKELISNNNLFVIPFEVHNKAMIEDGSKYIMGQVRSSYIMQNIGRVREIDNINKTITIDVKPGSEDYINNMKNPKVSFLAWPTFNKVSPIFYIKDYNERK